MRRTVMLRVCHFGAGEQFPRLGRRRLASWLVLRSPARSAASQSLCVLGAGMQLVGDVPLISRLRRPNRGRGAGRAAPPGLPPLG